MTAPKGPRDFVRVLAPAMAQAAAIASALQGRVPNVPKPGAKSAVKAALTIADTAAQEALLVPLLANFRARSSRSRGGHPQRRALFAASVPKRAS